MQIIKLGGSLSQSQDLLICLQRIKQKGQGRVVLVPGGGGFADQVRLAQQYWQFNDVIAHEMAILAMQQMALVFKGLQPDFILAASVAEIKQTLRQPALPIIWSPSIHELNQAGVAASWEITSDSLAAWLATQLEADELILVKAAAVESNSLAHLSQQGVIDKAFMQFVANARFAIHILNKEHFYEL
jgi:aspartokinase-like uncharacterized kinase